MSFETITAFLAMGGYATYVFASDGLTALTFGGLLLSGVAVPEWRINHRFLPTTCTILGKGLARRTTASADGQGSSAWQPCLRVRYRTMTRDVENWSRPPRRTLTSDREQALAGLEAWRLGDSTRRALD